MKSRWIRYTNVMIGILLFAARGYSIEQDSLSAETDTSPLSPPTSADPDFTHTLQHHAWVRDWTESLHAEAETDPEIWVAPGIVANRDQQRITLWAEATGLPSDTPVEFLLIGELSGHDYEAIAISYARPIDVYEALTFIGLPPGNPVMPRDLRFFPKGERVNVFFRWRTDEDEYIEVKAESLVRDRRSGDALPTIGFTFVGSHWLDVDGERVLAAEQRDPRSIISVYNEPTTLLDPPRQAGQQQLFGFLHAYPDRQPAFGTLLEVVLVPERTDGARRVVDVVLAVNKTLDGIELQLQNEAGKALHEDPSLPGVLAAFEELKVADQTPFVQVESAMSVPLAELRSLYRWLRAFQDEDILYMEPPQGDELFYRAFLPNEAHRNPAQRPSQALELRIPATDREQPAEVVHIQDQRRRIDDEFDPSIETHAVPQPEELPRVLADIDHHLPVLLVFAPAQMTLGELMTWLGPVRETHPTVHLFLD